MLRKQVIEHGTPYDIIYIEMTNYSQIMMYVKLKRTSNQVDPSFANDVGKSLMMEVEQILLPCFGLIDPTFILFKS